jgi:hypothetical protein
MRYEECLVLLLREGTHLADTPTAGQRTELEARLQRLVHEHGLEVDPIFSDAVRGCAEALRASGVRDVPPVERYARVWLPPGGGADLARVTPQVLDALDGLVSGHYVRRAGTSSPRTPRVPTYTDRVTTPDLRADQVYLDGPDAGGIGARETWRRAGGNGAGIRVVDVEQSWISSHEALTGIVNGQPGSTFLEHGTASLGVLAARPAGPGVTGICHGAEVSFSSTEVLGEEEAIARAACALRPGDVILVEAQRPHARGVNLPVEWWPADWAAIRLAHQRGVLVVAAAANGGTSLDLVEFDTWPVRFPPHGNPLRRGRFDSGSILVGAGVGPPLRGQAGAPGEPRSRDRVSNWGSAVDAQGWGSSVTTCGGDGEIRLESSWNRAYTKTWDGTSSAAAIVAGALACIQGMILAVDGRDRLLTPVQARDGLRTRAGLAQPRPAAGPFESIGSLPNLLEWP